MADLKIDKPIAVHLHLYYTDMWDELSLQLQNLQETPYHLFVTIVENNNELIEKIKKFHLQTTVWVVKNMGYDIGPFIDFLNRINLDDYSYILKLHSKRPSNGTDTKLNHLPVTRYYWKILLSEALIGTPQIWQRNINAFEKNSQLGMIASPHLIKKADKSDEFLIPDVKKQLQKITLPEISNFYFVAGTMFLVRSSLFKVLQHKYKIEDFQTTDGQVKDGTLAHVFERLFGAVICSQGYQIKGFSHNYKFVCSALGKIIGRFFFQKKTTKHNKVLIKICKIPVFQKNL
jgi:lipopolysaccharide biosynthesis protein